MKQQKSVNYSSLLQIFRNCGLRTYLRPLKYKFMKHKAIEGDGDTKLMTYLGREEILTS